MDNIRERVDSVKIMICKVDLDYFCPETIAELFSRVEKHKMVPTLLKLPTKAYTKFRCDTDEGSLLWGSMVQESDSKEATLIGLPKGL